MNYQTLPRESYVRLRDLTTTRNQIGITPFSSATIKKLIRESDFPKPYQIENVRGKFFVYGEILDWLKRQGKHHA